MLPHQPWAEQQSPNPEPAHVMPPPQSPSTLTFLVEVGAGGGAALVGVVLVMVVSGLSGIPAPGPVGSLVGEVVGGIGESAGSVLSGALQVPNWDWQPPPQ